MGLFKKRVIFEEAVDVLNQALLDDIAVSWPAFSSEVRERHEDFIIEDEDIARYEIFLACTALELLSINNIFTKNIADKLHKIIFETVNTEDIGEYAINKLLYYEKDFKKAIIEVDNPLTPVSGRLLQSILGERIRDFHVRNSDFINPLLLMEIMTYLTTLIGRWKKINNDFRLV